MTSVNSTVRPKRPLLASVAVSVVLVLGACTTAEVLNQGYIVDERSLELTPVGSSR